ncbi:MAG: ribosomal protein S18-alanine N-acetyltransferase [Thermomicrobiales bacterium]|nr:ribosomal protein S18-alanine N-acetyltransferase [Thermomicrobiales bacterium]
MDGGIFQLDFMTLDDVAEVGRVERRCFANPWPQSAYRRELRYPEQNCYLVLRDLTGDGRRAEHSSTATGWRGLTRIVSSLTRKHDDPPDRPGVAGFAGMWVMYEEAHITTIGVDPVYQGQGLGEVLLAALFEEAINRDAARLTLEVRVSNRVAQRLYEKYAMTVQGVRPRYYTDNGEDAWVMVSRPLRDPSFLALFDDRRRLLMRRMDGRLVDSPHLPFDTAIPATESVE